MYIVPMVLVTRNGTNIHTVLSLMSQEKGLNPPFPNSAWHSGLLHGNRGWFRAKDWATRVTWVRVARSIFASRCGFLMCNRAKLWTPWGGVWLEQKLPKCEVTQWTQAGKNYKSPGFLILPLFLCLSLSPGAASHLLHVMLTSLFGGQKQG